MKHVFAVLLAAAAAGCVSQKLKVEPVMVAPIHVTIDVNVHDQTAPPPEPETAAQ